jgi:Tfp pilus assembly protein PilV
MNVQPQTGATLVRRGASGPVRRSLDESGFLLLEVVLAMALLTISLFAIIDSLGRCVAAAKSVQSYSVSEILLANKSFEFRAERAGDIFDQEGTFNDYPGYSWSRRLERTENDGLWKQTIAVYWHERGNIVSDAVIEYRYLPEKQQ